MSESKLLWWGYRHTSGTFQVKRYFDQRDIDEAIKSPFVASWYGPFEAKDRDEALEIVKSNTF